MRSCIEKNIYVDPLLAGHFLHGIKSDLYDIVASLQQNMVKKLEAWHGRFPAACSEQGHYPLTDNTDWTTGFWSGMGWLTWHMTQDERILHHLNQQVVGFAERLDRQHDIDTHDLGFLYSLSCVNGWRLTGNENARHTALRAADLLIARYHPKAQIIQAWGDLNDPQQKGRMIIDCMMNLPLLFWASEQTGNPVYTQRATNHAAQARRFLLRADRSTFHTFYMDVDSGQPLKGTTHQGYADESCWARGQAWAIYGFTLSYSYTGDRRFLQAAIDTAHYFLCHLPKDGICYWDLSLTEPGTAKDSSAAAIAACGLLELAKHLSVLNPDARLFVQRALLMIDELSRRYFQGDALNNGMLLHSVYNMNKKRGVDEYCIWGDYFFVEAISRLTQPLAKYW